MVGLRIVSLAVAAVMCMACQRPPLPATKPVSTDVRNESMKWASALVVTRDKSWRPLFKWSEGAMTLPDDAEGGSATPVTSDGYFLTASHVLGTSGDQAIHLLYGPGSVWRQARVVWRHARSDLALLHVDIPTPGYFRWTDPGGWVPAGTRVFHVGIATGLGSQPGEMLTGLGPERFWTRHRMFKIDMPLEPGDSGGAVLDADGRLVGINSAVQYLVPMETAFFIDSEGGRPSIASLERIIRLDRESRRSDQ